MPRLIAGVSGLVILISSATAQTATPAAGMPRAWRLVHPDAVVMLGVDVRSIRQSAAGKSLDKSISQASMGMLSLPALQFLRDIDQVVLSAPGESKLAAKAPVAKIPGKAANSPVLIILTGHFSDAHMHSLLKGTHSAYNGVLIYGTSPGGVNSEVALLNESTLLFGDPESLRGAIDRSQSSTVKPSPLLTRAASLAAGNDFWLLATALPSMRAPVGLQPAGFDLQSLTSGLRGVEAGVAFHDGMKLAVTLMTKDAETATKLVRLVTAKMQSSMQGKLDTPQAAEFLKKLDLTAEGNQVRVKFSMSPAEMERAVALAQTMNATRPSFTLRSPAPPPDPGTIKVYGMPGGVVEIPVDPGKRE